MGKKGNQKRIAKAALPGKIVSNTTGKRVRETTPGLICVDMTGGNDDPPPSKHLKGVSLPLNEPATVNCPTSGLMQRASKSTVCGDCSNCSPPDQSDAQSKAEICAVSITGSIFDALGLTERKQVGSILRSLQEMGLELDSLVGSASENPQLYQIRARIDTPSYHTVNPGLEVTVLIECGRSRDTLYNSPLFRHANVLSDGNSCRRRKPFDRFLEQPIPVSRNGEHFGYSFADHDGKVVCFLVVERAAHSAKEWLSSSAENWRLNGQMDERVRSFLQLAVHGAYQLRDNNIVLGDVNASTIGVNQDGCVVFQGSGNSLRYDASCSGNLLKRRTTSFIVCGNNTIPIEDRYRKKLAEKMQTKLLRGRAVKAAGVRKRLPRRKVPRAPRSKGSGAARKICKRSNQQSDLPLDEQPTFLSRTKIAEIWQGVVATSKGLASLGDGSVHFKKVAESSTWTALESLDQPLSFLEASRRDMYGLLRTGLMVFNPVDEANPSRWEQEATAAEGSQDAMKRFLTKRIAANGPSQTQYVDRAAQFFYYGFKSLDPERLQDHAFLTLPIHPASTYQRIFNGDGVRVTGGKMDGVGAPQAFSCLTLKDVLVKEQKGMGAGLQSDADYKTGDLITFYFGKARRGREILEDPPGRYVLAVLPHTLYANGEFSETRTLATITKKKAMGVCINAANTQQERNCTMMRLKSECDSEGNIWTPVVASRPIARGEYFGSDYGPEAAKGRSFSQ